MKKKFTSNLLRTGLYLAAAALLVAVIYGCSSEPAPEPPETLTRFYEAFNSHDVEAMLELAHEDIRMYSVSGPRISTDIDGKDELRTWLTNYFAEYPEVRSEISGFGRHSNYTSLVETATWGDPDDPVSQSSTVVYEVSDSLVVAAWYYY
ncbi:MAG: nuclear transport factor 2 family protein [Balneolaceae bacterium]|nr:nuclear transport factor 2 family protein [Balneolaceae bacterium]